MPERTKDTSAADMDAMSTTLIDVLNGISVQPQRQDSTNAQLADLAEFANRLGLDVPALKGPGTALIGEARHLPARLLAALEKLPQQPLSKDSVEVQRAQLRWLANRLGLYDAADCIWRASRKAA